MKTFILCEGRTDSHLIGFYLESVKNFKYTNDPELIETEENQNIINLKQGKNNQITILSTGGKANLKNKLTEIIKRNYYERDKNKLIQNVIIVIDRDSDSDDDLIKYIGNGIESINEWNTITIENQLFDQIELNIFVLSIPEEEPGALEKFVIDSLKSSNNENDKIIIKELDALIEKLKDIEYLKKSINSDISTNQRYREKAKLGCYLSIYSPDWALDKITEKIKQIDWKNLKDINSIYEKIVQGL
jgi:hypothetical protein